MKNAVIFDFDGTLANTLPLVVFCFQEVFRTYTGKTYSEEEIIGMFGPPEHQMLEQVIAPENLADAKEQFEQLYRSHHSTMVEEYHEIQNLTSELRRAGFRLGIFTGKGRNTMEISKTFLPFVHEFEVVLTGDDVVRAKPHPEGILLVLSQLQMEPETAIYVGDSNSDIVAAHAAGVTPIAVQWMPKTQSSHFDANPAHVFEDTEAFLHIILEMRG